jgi:WD40 repeat protein
MLFNRQMIEEAPLQAYLSAVVFAPMTSMTRQNYSHELPEWLCRLPKARENWGKEILTMDSGPPDVRAIAFSPDDWLIASTSQDNVRLWSVNTGAAYST